MSTSITMLPHSWTHLITVKGHLGEHTNMFGEEQSIQAEVQEITGRKSGYRAAKSMILTMPKDDPLPAIGAETAVKLNDHYIVQMRRPDLAIDKISLNLAMMEADSVQGLFSLYLNARYTTALTEEHRTNMTLRLNDGYVRAKRSFDTARFQFGSIIVEQEIPQSVQAAMRGDLLKTYVEHSSIDDLAVITHVVENAGEIHIDYDVHSVHLSDVFGPLNQYLHLKAGTNIELPALKGIT
jgi:hypothetical protein